MRQWREQHIAHERLRTCIRMNNKASHYVNLLRTYGASGVIGNVYYTLYSVHAIKSCVSNGFLEMCMICIAFLLAC